MEKDIKFTTEEVMQSLDYTVKTLLKEVDRKEILMQVHREATKEAVDRTKKEIHQLKIGAAVLITAIEKYKKQ